MTSVYTFLSLDTAAAADALATMLEKEQTISRTSNYLAQVPPTIINEDDRLKLVDWCYCLIDKLNLNRETVMITIGMVDRYLSKPSSLAKACLQDRQKFQLLVVSALYTSVKINESFFLSSDRVSSIIGDVYTAKDIESMELKLLQCLNEDVCRPTSVEIASHVLSLILPHVPDIEDPTWCTIVNEVRFHAECAVRDYQLSLQRSSTVAIAAIFNAVGVLDHQTRKRVLDSSLLVLDKRFSTPTELLSATTRLSSLVKQLRVTGGNMVVSESPRQPGGYPTRHVIPNTDLSPPRRVSQLDTARSDGDLEVEEAGFKRKSCIGHDDDIISPKKKR